MPLELFANQPQATVSSGGTDAPASGTSESFTMSGGYASFPAASNTAVPATQFHIYDPALSSEIMLVTNVSGTTWTVTRGAESTTPVAHAAGFTVLQDITAGVLSNLKQAPGAATTAVTVGNSASEAVVATYQPVTGEVVNGTTFEAVAFGSIETYSTAPTLTWRLRWGGLSGTVILSMVTGTNCPALVTSIASGSSFDVNGSVTFLSSTSAVANINFWWQKTTTTYEGVASSGSAVTVSGSGPLVLTAQWSVAETTNSLTAVAPLIYRAG